MTPEFEIKYIEIQWYDKNTITKIIESLVGLSLEFDTKTECFECETTIYPKVEGIFRGQLAIRFFNNPKGNAYIEMPNGETKYLTPIKDIDTDKTWWIIQDSWDKKSKYWRHSGVNTAGTMKYMLNGSACNIHIGSMDFTRDQLEDYLRSFKNDLWELILDESSSVQTDRQSNGVGVSEGVIDCINNLISNSEKVLINPKSELREVQALKPRKAVKPVNRTFMELASKTNQRFLTSRATIPSYNTAENCYVLFALERCFRIIKQIVILSDNKSKRYADKVTKLQNQHDSFTSTITVDRDLVVKDLKVLRERCHLKYWQKKFEEKLELENIVIDEYEDGHEALYIRTEGYSTDQNSKNKDGFFISVYVDGHWGKSSGKYTILKLKCQYASLIDCLSINFIYKIIGKWGWRNASKSVVYDIFAISKIQIFDIPSLTDIQESYKKERTTAQQLSSDEWKRKLNKNELDEQVKEKKALLNRINFYSENQSVSEYIYGKIEPKQRLLIKYIEHLKSLGIKASSRFPNSMTFVQNPHYRGVHNSYKTLREITNLSDEELLVSLEEIDAVGLVNMPILYERWCLLQIVKILKEPFRFTPESNWKYQLIDAVKTKKTDIEITFSNTNAQRFITLTYEKTLDNGKRPDYVIDLEWYAKTDNLNQSSYTKRFVMDAKFYDKGTFDRSGGLMGVVDGLARKKNYSEANENPVFVIHPCRTVLQERVTPQEWGKYSFLGELPTVGSNYGLPHHSGGIFLSPINKELYADELQRLLGMFFQYKLEASNTVESSLANDLTVSIPICIRCGSTNIRKIHKSSGYHNQKGEWVERTSRSVWMQCNECEQFISFNHCKNTSTRLIKNGYYWTYHSAKATEPFNNKCPSCGEWGAW